jgi:hypothetical protein|tara:strand:- start:8296 stop:8613 length:318 start_codon:yes stop_codon:yes gene_type:complete
MEILIQKIRFVYPGCKLHTRETIYKSYGNEEINGSKSARTPKGKPTHFNLNKHNADRVYDTLKEEIKIKLEGEKREKEAVKLAKEAEKPKVIEAKKKKKATKKPK